MFMKSQQESTLFWYALLGIIIPVYYLFTSLNLPYIGVDDANIVFVYAKNFSNGYGIVYNMGGEHVEGCSSFLYFLVCSVFFFFSSKPEFAILVWNVSLAVISCMSMLISLKTLSKKAWLSVSNRRVIYSIFLGWLLINPLYFVWNVVSLMDAGIYSSLLLVSYSYFMQLLLAPEAIKFPLSIICALIMLIMLCRPEGLLWGLGYGISYLLIQYVHEKQFVSALKNTMAPLFTYLLTGTLLTLFRWFYFGYPLPNTYYAKVSAHLFSTLHDGMMYFREYYTMYGVLIFLPAFVLLRWVFTTTLTKQYKHQLTEYILAFITLLFIMTGLLLPIMEGGDHFHGLRLYQPTYPLLIMPLILFLLRVFSPIVWKIKLISLLFLGLTAYCSISNWGAFIHSNKNATPIRDLRLSMMPEFNIAYYSRANGLALNEIFNQELPTIGYGSAGGIAYTYKGIVYDLMGLNNTLLAHADAVKQGPKGHQSFNKEVFYTLAPDLFMPTALAHVDSNTLRQAQRYYTDIHGWDNLIFKNIFNDKQFKTQYTLALIQNIQASTYSCYAYVNHHYLERLLKNTSFHVILVDSAQIKARH
jgi:hypothetical protein